MLPSYRCEFFDGDGGVAACHEFEAADNEQAALIASALHARRGRQNGFALWRGDLRIDGRMAMLARAHALKTQAAYARLQAESAAGRQAKATLLQTAQELGSEARKLERECDALSRSKRRSRGA